MNKLRVLAATAAALVGSFALAWALTNNNLAIITVNGQVNPATFDLGAIGPGSVDVQEYGFIATDTAGTAFINKPTFSFAAGPITSFAASATDGLVITGSGTKVVRIANVTVCGTASAGSTIDVIFIKRSTADTGGTSSSVTGVPNDSSNAAATTAVATYTANPTTGTAVGNVHDFKLNLGAAGSAGCATLDGGTRLTQPVILRGTAQQLAVNFNGVSLPAGASIDYRVEVTEE